MLFIEKVNLQLFDGEAGNGGTMGATQTSDVASQTKGETVVYGKQQTTDHVADEPATQSSTTVVDDIEAKRKAYNELINGEYKDFYTEDTQKMINRRFKETKNLEKQLSSQSEILNMLTARYGLEDGDLSALSDAIENDDFLWEVAADEAGMTVDQYRKFSKLEREHAKLLREREESEIQTQVDQWILDAEAIKQTYPDFDFATEWENPQFKSLLQAGIPMQHAYQVIHIDEQLEMARVTAQRETEKRVTDNVRAKGMRPAENGTASNSAFTIKDDVRKLSKKDRAAIVEKVRRGEQISF